MSTTAVILCGGQGTRLRPVIGDLPKCLAPAANRPFLFYILDHLYDQGVRQFVFCTGYEGDLVQITTEALWLKSKELLWLQDAKPMGSGGALRNVLSHTTSDPVLVVNGDTYCTFDLNDLLERYKISSRLYSCVDLRGRKPPVASSPFLSTGVRLISRRFIKFIPQNVNIDIEECLQMLRNTVDNYSIFDALFIDIGTPEGYAQAEEFHASRERSRE